MFIEKYWEANPERDKAFAELSKDAEKTFTLTKAEVSAIISAMTLADDKYNIFAEIKRVGAATSVLDKFEAAFPGIYRRNYIS